MKKKLNYLIILKIVHLKSLTLLEKTMNSVYITYNYHSEAEESTALRLQTLSSLYGFKILLPNRLSGQKVSQETIERIKKSQFVLVFCLENLSKTLKSELEEAIKLDKPIVVIYDENKGKKINFDKNVNVKEVSVNFNDTDNALHSIAEFLKEKLKPKIKIRKKEKSDTGLGLALVGVGLGLLALWALSKEK